MGKNTKRFILLAIIILIPVILCGCSLFKILGLTGTSQLATPEGIELSEDGSYISWDTVQYASGYEIYIDGTKIGQSNNNQYYFVNIDGNVDIQIKAISVSNKYTQSELSAAAALNIKSRLVISGVSHLISTTNFIVYWADVNYKTKYTVKIYEDGVLQEEIDVYTPSLNLPSYEGEKEYRFDIKAIADSSGKRVDSLAYSLTIEAGTALSTVINIAYDKNGDMAPEINNTTPSAIKVYLTVSGTKTDITSNCIIGEDTVTIKTSYIDTLPINIYNGEFDAGSRKFALIVTDTREMELSNITFVKNSDYAFVAMSKYANSILNIDINGVSGHTSYDSERIIIAGEYLDGLADDEYALNVQYGQGSNIKQISAVINVISLPATIAADSSYSYHGQYPLTVIFNQKGDTVTSLVLSEYGTVNISNYSAAKNSLTLDRDFLISRGNGTFLYCINTAKGSALSFTVITDIRDFALQFSEYMYDKASDEDMLISAIIVEAEDFDAMYGASITEEDYIVAEGVGITLDRDYVSALNVGSYEYICLSGDIVDYFTLNITNSQSKPYNVKLNYDISASDVYISFSCDCGGGHTYSLNGGADIPCPSKRFIVNGIDKTVSNTLRIRCTSSGRQTTIVKSAPASAASAYVNARYNFEGCNRDKYIESQEELNHFVRYMVMRGYDAGTVTPTSLYGKVEDNVYYSADFLSGTTAQAALTAAVNSFSSPWGYGINASSSGNVYSLTVNYQQYPGYDITTEYVGSAIADTRVFLTASTRSPAYNSFYIETMTKTQTIRNSSELVDLPLGVRPTVTASSAAEELYLAAKVILREIISDTMTDREKVEAIYYWLTTNVAYDSDAILLYNLYGQVSMTSILGTARSLINSFLSSYPQYSDLLTPIRDKALLSDLKDTFNSTIKRMRVFAAEGAILDKKAVCNGIAYAVNLLCKIEGIESIKISGLATSGGNSENHAWNKVKINGVWYVVDATWGRMGNYVVNKYLLTSDYSIMESHREESGVSGIRNIEYLATGNIDYYSTVIVGEYDLTIDSTAEMNAVVAQLYNQGVRTIELRYNMEGSFSTAIANALSGVHFGSYYTTSSGNIYIVKLS